MHEREGCDGRRAPQIDRLKYAKLSREKPERLFDEICFSDHLGVQPDRTSGHLSYRLPPIFDRCAAVVEHCRFD